MAAMDVLVDVDVDVVLLDIEGTVCPISFVKDVLFPYALRALPSTLSTQWTAPAFQPYLLAFPPSVRSTPSTLTTHITTLMAADIKDPALKSLQGYLWLQGYETGELRCPLFADVHPALHRWTAAGNKILIYSSGSVPAQKLLFQYTNVDADVGTGKGDLRPFISGYEDTTTAGPKITAASYEVIRKRYGGEAGRWLFLSDNVLEVRAAREAGMRSLVVVREGNKELTREEREGQVLVGSFESVKIKGV